jgi:uncharacterized repeat protein (TIGR03847 family)
MPTLTLDRPHHVTAGTVGEPGNRTFLVQVEDTSHRVTVVAEKQQVAGMGDLVARLLVRLDLAPATDWDEAAMALREPIDPAWRVGEIELALAPEEGRVVVQLTGLDVDDDAPFDAVTFSMDTDQARRLAGHVDVLVDQGRPRCELCGRPMTADGTHVCPSTNGHGRLTV